MASFGLRRTMGAAAVRGMQRQCAVQRQVGAARALSSVATSLQSITEEEAMFKEMVSKFANEKVAPRVRAMDEAQKMDPEIIQAMFDQGLMGVEIDEKYGGSNASFMSAILVIEELAKVDASVSVCCDVQNTLVNNLFRFYANDHIKDKYLPRLATTDLGSFGLSEPGSGSDAFALKTTAKKIPETGEWEING